MSQPIQPPDYSGGSIVNLMQSLAKACGSGNALYPQLAAMPAELLAGARHIVLFVVDGLGQEAIDRPLESRNLRKHWLSTLSSVFPPTTATAIPVFMTGLAPSRHALTGWHMYLEEIDQTLAILPLTPRGESAGRSVQELPPLLFDYPTLFEQLDRECWVLAPKSIAGSPFNDWHSRGAETLAYNSLAEMFSQIAGLLENAPAPRYIYAYYSELDKASHDFGTHSPRARQTLALFDEAWGKFVNEVQGRDAWLLLTADHGFIDSPPERVVSLDDHPRLAALLTRPLCGERRAAYCYVTPENRPAFETYVCQNLAYCTILRRSADMICDGWYGPPPFHPHLAARVGDYTLLMRDNWTIKDWLPGEKRYSMLGVHGGVSPDEMRVPLIALKV